MSKNVQQPSPIEPTSERPHPNPKSLRWWMVRFGNVGLLFAVGVMLIVLLGIAQRVGWIRGGGYDSAATSESSTTETYTCPMHPQIRQSGPGRCPICGMALVPATASAVDLDELSVTIEPAQRRLANIKTAEVTKQSVSTTIQTIGAIQIDESRQATIASYIDGRVERLFADYTGVEVDKGDHLAVVYSPQLYAAQVEYLEARRALASNRVTALASVREAQSKLVTNSRQRLVELGMTEQQLAELESSDEPKSRLTVYAPIGGTVIEKLAEEGKYISAGEPIYRIANLSTVWLMLELYPQDASRIRFGQVVEAELSSMPGKTLTGRVAFIDPKVNTSNRTVGVRVEFDNAQGELRPGDYAQATIDVPIGPQGEVYDEDLAGKWISPMHPQIIRDEPGDCPICGMQLVPTSQYGYVNQPVPQPQSVVVPRSAVLLAGDQSVVYVETEPGRFEIRDVTLGPILQDRAVVLDGLTPGEQVATSGNFLIDSQMQLAGKPSVIDPTRLVGNRTSEGSIQPLEFDSIAIRRVPGAAGQQLEQLFDAYFEIQVALAADRQPSQIAAEQLSTLSQQLASNEAFQEPAVQRFTTIHLSAEHLHHLPLTEARVRFKEISHAVIALATEVRGEMADRPFRHFFCPMVKRGGGDWLQVEELLSNPYFGAEMLRCGELVQTIPPENHLPPMPDQPEDSGSETPTHEGDH